MNQTATLFIKWNLPSDQRRTGEFQIRQGEVKRVTVHSGQGRSEKSLLHLEGGEVVVEIEYQGSTLLYGAQAVIIHWCSEQESFSFIPANIPQGGVIQVPDLQVVIGKELRAVTAAAPGGAYESVLKRVDSFRGREITWENWSKRNNSMTAPTVLGLSRDQRLFIIDPYDKFCHITATRDLTKTTVCYSMGRAATADAKIKRSLEEGTLPILTVSENFGAIQIEETYFVSYIDRPLTEENHEGTPLEIAHYYSALSTFPEGVKVKVGEQNKTFIPAGEVVLFVRTKITNTSDLPTLAPHWIPRAVMINRDNDLELKMEALSLAMVLGENGVALTEGLPLSRHWVDGLAPAANQVTVLLPPQGSMRLDSIFSHCKEGLSEAAQKQSVDWDLKLAEVRSFWKAKTTSMAKVALPEKRLSEFWKAGFHHLDLITLGENHSGPLLAKVGVYTPIGTESLPIIEFYDSVGCHDLARRSIDAFFELQHPNGRLNLFSYYDIESGAGLYLAGKHFAYTQDLRWVKERMVKFKLACDYILSTLQKEDPLSESDGLSSGTCADPTEKTTAFMLNAYNVAGLRAAAEMMEKLGLPEAKEYRASAEIYRLRLISAIDRSFAKGPLLPTALARWVPTCSCNVEGTGMEMMALKGKDCYTHRSYTAFDALIGPLYAVFTGLISPQDQKTQWLLEVNQSQLNRASIGESQPYYSRHPEVHLMRGEKTPFLNAFYSSLCAMMDHETFTFWEHLYKLSVHKTHEEGWALMQLRRMLWLEVGEELRLLPGIPQSWVDPGESIEISGAGSYFGALSFSLKRSENGKEFHFKWEPHFHTAPQRVKLHLPGFDSSSLKLSSGLKWIDAEWVLLESSEKAFTATMTLL